jgi:D-3-phosphoglycerate dehydrogenase
VATHPVAEMVPDLDAFLPRCDYISLHTPLTDGTRGMFRADVFAKMKPGVVIVNTGRGKVIVEADLAEALKSGKVGAYATDVWYSDPPDPTCPLLTAPNVLMTPHLGASSRENLGRIGNEVVEILSKGIA